jgi:hypothetical protein
MNSVQSTFSSARNQRIMFFGALLVLIAGIVLLVVKFVGTSSQPSVAPDKGFKPQLPQKTTSLTAANGGKITSYLQLPASIKQAIQGFVVPGVINQNYGASYKYTAPNITEGVSQHKWATVDARSVIPMPGYTVNGATYKLEEASTKEIILTITMQPTKPSVGRPTPMRIGLVPYGKGAAKHWLVNYWMPATSNVALPYGGDG